MRKKFVSRRKRRKKGFLKVIIYIFITLILYELISSFFLNIKLFSSNEQFLKMLLKDNDYYLLYEKNNNTFINKLIYNISSFDIDNPLSILENNYHYNFKETNKVETSSDEEYKPTISEYIEDPSPKEEKNPRIYLYNTHQLEEYNSTNYEEYNITPNVMMASYILREKLNNLNIPSLVETSDVTTLLNTNGWNYASSYKASKYFIQSTLEKYPNLDLLIDIHRDALPKDRSTVNINGKNYAKVLFVVGLDHPNYEANLKVTEKINNLISKDYPTLTRGILKKQGKNVNGIYNQDLNGHIILMECGGNENKIDEVMNTLEVIANVIKQYLEE